MSSFLGLVIQSDVRCASGAIVAVFPPTDLIECKAELSPIEQESLTVTVQRTDERAAELVPGRVVRTRFTDSTLDREWDVAEFLDTANSDTLTVVCRPIGLRLSRVLIQANNAATGAPEFAFDETQATPSDIITDRVLPACAAAGLTWIAAGTVDPTARVDLSAEWITALQLVQALADPSRGNAEWQLRRNGDTDYKLDLLTSIGSSAATVRIRTAQNLLENRRQRSLDEVATRIIPRGSSDGTQRTMADHLWRVAAVPDGTHLDLEDPDGGSDPILFDDQVNGLYVAVLNSHSFSSQVVTDSTVADQRITVASTAGVSAGDLVRFFVATGANGARVVSLKKPTAVLAPVSGGLGDRAMILDATGLRGDCNLVPNPWMRTWTTEANAPDGWTRNAGTPANVTWSRETTIIRGSPYAQRVETTGSSTLSMETDDIPVWAISGRRHFGALWFNVQAVPAAQSSALVLELITAGGTLITELGRWVRGADPLLDTWIRFQPDVVDLSAVTSAVRLRLKITTAVSTSAAAASGWDVIIGPAMLAEAEVPIADIEGSGGTKLWQTANAKLATVAEAIRGYDLRVMDLARDDAATFADFRFTPGGTVEVTDTDLSELTSLRLLVYRPDYLNPLLSEIRVGVPESSVAVDIGTSPIGTPTPGTPTTPTVVPPTLSVSWRSNDTHYTITWSGGPVVLLSIDEGSEAEPPTSPIVVERDPDGLLNPTYSFVAVGSDGTRSQPISVTVVAQAEPPVTPPPPAPTVVASPVLTLAVDSSDCGTEYEPDVAWSTNDPDDTLYKCSIYDQFDALVLDDVGMSGSEQFGATRFGGGAGSYTFQYRVKVIRRADDVVMNSEISNSIGRSNIGDPC